MARLLRSASLDGAAELAEMEQAVEDEYRQALAAPAVVPWDDKHVPVTIGNTWRVGDDGRFVLPEWSLGWEYLRWTATRLRMNGDPYRPTLEQLRLVLWMMEVDPVSGKRLHVTCVVQRLKGWGKDPLLATVGLFQFDGPSQPWDLDESTPTDRPDSRRVVGRVDENAWCQLAAVSSEQTKNTVLLLPSMYPPSLAREQGIVIGAEKTRAVGTSRLLEAVTSNPATMEGGRPTFSSMNEPHLWVDQNRGTAMSEVMDRNATKVANSWVLAVTNAYEPGMDSVAEKFRDQHHLIEAGDAFDTGLYYDSLEAPPTASMRPDEIPHWLRAVRGDSTWLDIPRVTAACLDTRIPPSRARRFYYNAIETSEDRWLDSLIVNRLCRRKDEERNLQPGDALFVFFDGSKSMDNTGLVGCRLDDGAVFQLGVWRRPQGLRKTQPWVVPRMEVNARVAEVMEAYRVVGLWGDPSDARDDEEERYWAPMLDEWHRLYGKKLKLWAGQETGPDAHSVSWDMRTPSHVKTFVQATMLFAEEAEARQFFIGDEVALRRHLKNARKRVGKYGTGIGKESESSEFKIDLAVCAIGARMMRRAWQNRKVAKKQTNGRVVPRGIRK